MQQRTNPSNIFLHEDFVRNWKFSWEQSVPLKPQLRNAFPNRAHRSHSRLVRSHDLVPKGIELRDRFASLAVHASVFEHRRSHLV